MVNANRRLTELMDTTRRNDAFCSRLELVNPNRRGSRARKRSRRALCLPEDIIGSCSDPRLNLISAGVSYGRVAREYQ